MAGAGPVRAGGFGQRRQRLLLPGPGSAALAEEPGHPGESLSTPGYPSAPRVGEAVLLRGWGQRRGSAVPEGQRVGAGLGLRMLRVLTFRRCLINADTQFNTGCGVLLASRVSREGFGDPCPVKPPVPCEMWEE